MSEVGGSCTKGQSTLVREANEKDGDAMLKLWTMSCIQMGICDAAKGPPRWWQEKVMMHDDFVCDSNVLLVTSWPASGQGIHLTCALSPRGPDRAGCNSS